MSIRPGRALLKEISTTFTANIILTARRTSSARNGSGQSYYSPFKKEIKGFIGLDNAQYLTSPVKV